MSIVSCADSSLPYKSSDVQHWHKVLLELDHNTHSVLRLAVQKLKVSAQEQAHVLVVDDIAEMHIVMMQLLAWKAHVSVHWLANGVADLSNNWPLAEASSDLTQGFNSAAVFSAGVTLNRGSSDISKMLTYNVLTEGFPIHADIAKFGQHSLLHKMASGARKSLRDILPQLSCMEIESLLAATLMHSADHYYSGTLIVLPSRSEMMDCDSTLFRLTIVGHRKFFSRKLLCRENLDDGVCRAIYMAAIQVDPDFANDGLFIGIAA